MSEIQRRVKVFSFGESNVWEDIGTGFVTKDYIEVTRGEVLTITVRSEYDNSIIIQSKVLPDRSYKVQEGTMIVWTENESCDIALSFQEKAACDELWMKICEVQGHHSEDSDLLDRFDDSWSITELPSCELNKLDEILCLIRSVAPFPMRREALALFIEKEGYIGKLLDLFHICEDLENTEGLHHLYDIFKALFMFNNASLLQIMFQDDVMMDVIGCMEHNPNKPTPTRHREYLAKSSEYREVIKFSNPELLPKIHQTYKVQYIQEVILPTPSLFEENMMSALNSIILFNKTEIIQMINKDEPFLRKLFEQLCSEDTPEAKFRQLVALLKEICVFSLALEAVDRTKFFINLQGFGFMAAVEGMLMFEDLVVVTTAVDILNLISEFNAAILWEYTLTTKDNTNEDTQLLNIIISLLVDGEYVDIDVQLVNLIKAIVNPENISIEAATQTSDKALFLKYFYNHCMPRLLAPLMAQTASDKISKDTAQNAVILSHILDILSLCVRIHTVHVRSYIIDKNVLSRVLVLMMSSHGHLVLAALRFCRRIIGLKDEFYNRYIICKNLLSPIVKAFMATGHRYNLVNSAILELFNFIRLENVKSLVTYVMENFWSTLETVEYVDTFKNLKLKHDQEKDARENPLNSTSVGNVIIQRYKRDPRQIDEDEEAWFDEEEEEYINPFSTTSLSTPAMTTPTATSLSITTMTTTSASVTPLLSVSTTSPVSTYSKFVSMLAARTHSEGVVTHSSTQASSYSPRPFTVGARLQMMERNRAAAVSSYSVPTISAALQSLVDYDEDSDEENSTSAEDTPAPVEERLTVVKGSSPPATAQPSTPAAEETLAAAAAAGKSRGEELYTGGGVVGSAEVGGASSSEGGVVSNEVAVVASGVSGASHEGGGPVVGSGEESEGGVLNAKGGMANSEGGGVNNTLADGSEEKGGDASTDSSEDREDQPSSAKRLKLTT